MGHKLSISYLAVHAVLLVVFCRRAECGVLSCVVSVDWSVDVPVFVIVFLCLVIVRRTSLILRLYPVLIRQTL